MLEATTMAVLLLVGAMGGAVIGMWLVLKQQMPTHWTVIEGWESGPEQVFKTPEDAQTYIHVYIANGNLDASEWVVRGVVLLREEGDPR